MSRKIMLDGNRLLDRESMAMYMKEVFQLPGHFGKNLDALHGGGEGKQPVGRKSPMTPWGKKAMGVKTRNPKAKSSALIVRRKNGK